MEYIKRAAGNPPEADIRIRDTDAEMLARIRADGESAARAYVRKFDNWEVEVNDHYAAELLQVMASDLDWWRDHLTNYGSLFFGQSGTVTHGDKCSGTNHIMQTGKAARYSGGLNVKKFMKTLTWQKLDKEANLTFSIRGSRISRTEGMEGHARACDWRLRRYFPDRDWGFEVYSQKQHRS